MDWVSLLNKDGVSWAEAPKPFFIHRCKTQTTGWIGFMQVQRCACGGSKIDDGPWIERNSRR